MTFDSVTPRELSRELGLKAHQLGIMGAAKFCVRKFAQQIGERVSAKKGDDFDLRYGTDTSGVINVSSLGISSADAIHAVRYQTAMADVFPAILKDLPIRYEEFVFVDLGSGKGRALLLASSFPFKAIAGVELAESLHRIACKNIELYQSTFQQCHNITSVCGNAGNYDIPNENLVLYLFNPFDEEVISAVLSNIEASLRRFPRNIYILYLKPLHRHVFDHSTSLSLFKDAERYLIYQTASIGR